MLTPWNESQFNIACDVLESILDEIKRDDSAAEDCKSKAFEFQKYAELESLSEYMHSGNDKEQMRSLCCGLNIR
jgi:hypothetical protein